MSKFRMDDGTVVNTEKAKKDWTEATEHDGRNHISIATGSQWEHQHLYKSNKGRYYLIHSSDYQGRRDYAEWISEREATRWLLANNHELPEDLEALREEVEE